MPQVYFDRVQETGTAGLADFTLAGAVSGYQAFGTVMANGDTCSYCAVLGTQWEVGLGTYNAGVLARTTVEDSSTGGAKINFAGAPAIFLTWSAVDAANAGGGGTGTVTTVSVVTANGFSGSVANPTTTPAITIIAGNITPNSVTSTFSGNLTGNVTGNITGNAATVTTNANLTGPVTSAGNATTITDASVTLAKMADLAQDQFIGRTTASTGVPQTATITSAARTVLDDVSTAAMLTTLGGQPLDAALTALAAGSDFVQFSGPATSIKTFALPDASSTLATLAGTETLTNKRVTARVTTIVSSATPTVNSDNCDCVTITALAAAITSMTTNLTGTPLNFDQLEYRIKDDGTARAITWGASFVAGPTALPTTTVLSKALHVFFEWDSVRTAWVCLSSGSDA